MMFIKRGDGKILSVIEENDLNEEAKRAAKKFSSDKSSQVQEELKTNKLEK